MVYKTPESWTIERGSEIRENVQPSPTVVCGCGVNVGTLDWLRKNYPEKAVWKVLIPWLELAGAVVPYGTNGKFRVPMCKLIKEVGEEEERKRRVEESNGNQISIA